MHALVRAAMFGLVALIAGSCAGAHSQSGFERWLTQDAARGAAFARFEGLLQSEGVAGVVQNYQLWRTDRLAPECVDETYIVPPQEMWGQIVPALRFIRDHVKPAIGDVEVMSAYRDPAFNACVGGASQSAHRSFHALDMVPVRSTVTRETLIATLCLVHAREGPPARIGFGIYRARRFHIDARSYRGWGEDFRAASFPCRLN